MHEIIKKFALLAFCVLLLSGCFDVETEVNIMRDGSGFVTVWMRIPERALALFMALNGISLEVEQARVVQLIDQMFVNQSGVRLVERYYFREGENQVLRYRYLFETTDALNTFWSTKITDVPWALHNAKISWNHTGQDCDARYTAMVEITPRPQSEIYDFAGSEMADQPVGLRRMFAEEMLKGDFRLRVVLPGVNFGTDPTFIDAGGYPIWQTSMFGLFQDGLQARTTSRMDCAAEGARAPQPGESYPMPTTSMTVGPHAAMGEVLRVLGDLGQLVRLDINVTVHRRSEMSLTYRLDPRVSETMRSLLTLPFVTMPTLAQDWDVSTTEIPNGPVLFQIKTKRPLRLDETASPFVFAGFDGDRYVFRMKMPKLSFATDRPPEAPGRVVLKARVKMPGPIRASNATVVRDETAEWVLTERDLTQPITLEAICDD